MAVKVGENNNNPQLAGTKTTEQGISRVGNSTNNIPQANVSGQSGQDGDDGRSIESIERTSGDGSAGTTDIYTITYTYDDVDGGEVASELSKGVNFTIDLTGKAVQIYSLTADIQISISGLSSSIVKNKTVILKNSSGATRNITWGGSIDSTCWAQGDQLLQLANGTTYIISIFSYGDTIPTELFLSYIKKGT